MIARSHATFAPKRPAGMNDGTGWRIRRCALHEAAPDLKTAVEGLLKIVYPYGPHMDKMMLGPNGRYDKPRQRMDRVCPRHNRQG